MLQADPLQWIASALFALAVVHTFLTQRFEALAHRYPAHAGIWHFFGEVEAVFGIWAALLLLAMVFLRGPAAPVDYLEGLDFTEPMFVFVIMVVAASRPVAQCCLGVVQFFVRCLPLPPAVAFYFLALSVVPLLGSFITEPAAMTLAALMLRDHFYAKGLSTRLKYATLGVLFVNVSIGGTLTSFAAPPVLMVASKWGWDSLFMLTHIGWKAALAVLINAAVVSTLFAGQLRKLDYEREQRSDVPVLLTVMHLLCLAGVVAMAHHPKVFMAIFLLFLGVVSAYDRFQDRLILREGLMVALFLAGLVVLGTLQQWWLQPVLAGMDDTVLYFGATALTAVTDNAALTYLGSLVEGIDDNFRYALVTGAVTGGGLTVIANAPNPAGFAVLKEHFAQQTIAAGGLFVAALAPTCVAVLCFLLL
ncbi:putative Na+/H+ antiporter [Uliginosibacterium sp. H1]|uniref:putative Na+/H+ antiporter n=1 Tax=Uliginosibacterium sp. H1 TaxID=3114757 RepID=UPI002E1999FB|nr:putative Na+/H+ antiporter [Uliginosibacterium sp. H1]